MSPSARSSTPRAGRARSPLDLFLAGAAAARSPQRYVLLFVYFVQVLLRVGAPPKFVWTNKPLQHFEIGEALGLMGLRDGGEAVGRTVCRAQGAGAAGAGAGGVHARYSHRAGDGRHRRLHRDRAADDGARRGDVRHGAVARSSRRTNFKRLSRLHLRISWINSRRNITGSIFFLGRKRPSTACVGMDNQQIDKASAERIGMLSLRKSRRK